MEDRSPGRRTTVRLYRRERAIGTDFARQNLPCGLSIER
jgi:hypothetical protein